MIALIAGLAFVLGVGGAASNTATKDTTCVNCPSQQAHVAQK